MSLQKNRGGVPSIDKIPILNVTEQESEDPDSGESVTILTIPGDEVDNVYDKPFFIIIPPTSDMRIFYSFVGEHDNEDDPSIKERVFQQMASSGQVLGIVNKKSIIGMELPLGYDPENNIYTSLIDPSGE